MIYNDIYKKLCTERIVNLVCDKRKYSIVWDCKEQLNRAPMLLTDRWYASHDEALSYLLAHQYKVLQGYYAFTTFDGDFLGRCKEVTAVDLKAVEVARQHTDCCPLCGHELS